MDKSVNPLRVRTVAGVLQTVRTWPSQPDGQRWILRGVALFFIIGFFSWVRRDGDFRGYLQVGRLVLAHQHIYLDAPTGLNTWPPLFSLLCVPLALLAKLTVYLARGVWLVLSFTCLLVSLRILARVVYGCELSLEPDRGRGAGLSLARPEVLVPLLLTLRYIMASFEYMQIDMLLFALALAGLYLQARERPAAGGALLGLAAALKVMPILFIPYLAYRRRWCAAACAALAAATFSLSPILVFGWTRFWGYLGVWYGIVVHGWGSAQGNQSVFAMWDRFIGHGLAPLAVAGIPGLESSGDPRVVALTVASMLVVAAVAAWSFRGGTRTGWEIVSEWSVVFIVSAIFGAVCWKHYLVVLLVPNTLLFALWRSRDAGPRTRRAAAVILFVTFVLGACSAPGMLGKALAGRLEMASVVTLAALVTLGGLLWLRGTRALDPSVATVGTQDAALELYRRSAP
jgi:hypothetical protein